MAESVARIIAVFVLLVGPVVIGAATGGSYGELVGGAFTDTHSIGTLLKTEPVGEEVSIKGRITRVKPDYVSGSGNTYQQFYVSDGTGELLVFCSTKDGRTTVEQGDRVKMVGTFKDFYGTLELYTVCTHIELR